VALDQSDSRMLGKRVHAVRRFNRFYTRQIGLLNEGHLASPFSLTEVRVLYEIAHRERATASDLADELRIDPGYLSRILQRFEHDRLLERRKSATDGRQSHLALTARGRRDFEALDARSNREIAALVRPLRTADQRQLVGAMRTVEALLAARPEPETAYRLRPHKPGDLGWVVHRHGALYSAEYGWTDLFEGLVAGIVAHFVEHFDPERERCWIAERDGEIVGSIFLVKKSRTVAKLRLLYVEPSARGLGIGKRLVEECVAFARRAGYRKITLWTNSLLHAARHIYQTVGFVLVYEERHRHFGPETTGQTWELDLRDRSGGAPAPAQGVAVSSGRRGSRPRTPPRSRRRSRSTPRAPRRSRG